MARGSGTVREAIKTIEDKKAARTLGSSDSPRRLFFRLKDGESAEVRFLEDGEELNWSWVHQLPPTGNRDFGDKVPCLDQDDEGRATGEACPGCEKGYKRTFQGAINLIWRDAPKLQRDENGRLVRDNNNKFIIEGHEDQVALWTTGVTVYEELVDLDEAWSGLSSRDFKVTRRGSGLNTSYRILPAVPDGGAQKMSKADTALADNKYDLTEFVVGPPYDDWGKSKFQVEEKTEVAPSKDSPFNRKRA